jgi:hypothetical protein
MQCNNVLRGIKCRYVAISCLTIAHVQLTLKTMCLTWILEGTHPKPVDSGLVIVIPIHSIARQLDCVSRLPQVQVVGHDGEYRRTQHDDVDGGRGALRA